MTTAQSALERLLLELLHNACKYTPPGETITLAAHATAIDLVLSVSNTGVKIPTTE
nr:ATP-binding protein [Stenomitos frigidus]